MRYTISTIIMICCILGTQRQGVSMDTKYDFMQPLLGQCEKKFGISKIKLADDRQGVVADWSSPAEWDMFKGTSWRVDKGNCIHLTQWGAEYKWRIRRKKEYISITIVVSSTGNRVVLDRFVSQMTNRTAMFIPENKFEGLGDLCANLLHSDSRDWIWIYRNVFIKIEHSDFRKTKGPPLDTFALAKWIQNYAEKHLVQNISDYSPKISRFNISPSKVHVGDTFHVSVIPVGDKELKEYLLELDRDKSNHLDSWGEENYVYEFKALKPGPANLTFTIIDRKTLLSSQKTVTVEVMEKGQ